MKLSQSVAYAVQAVLRLGDGAVRGPISCSQLAAEGHMPERFLLQILRALARQGILHATRGGGGGFRLERPMDEVTLLDLIEAVDGPLSSDLPSKGQMPGASADRLQKSLRQIAESTRRQLAAVKLSDLMVAFSAEATATAAPTALVPPVTALSPGVWPTADFALGAN
jgi:Rrf2 family transcriptional regulator, cysteine metabolism repressor